MSTGGLCMAMDWLAKHIKPQGFTKVNGKRIESSRLHESHESKMTHGPIPGEAQNFLPRKCQESLWALIKLLHSSNGFGQQVTWVSTNVSFGYS